MLKLLNEPNPFRNLPNENEISNLINAMDNHGDVNHLSEHSEFLRLRNKVILALLYSSGLRVSELVMLHTDSIDLHDKNSQNKGKR